MFNFSFVKTTVLIFFVFNSSILYSQEDEEPKLYPATSLNELINYSSAIVVNNLPYDGTAFGFKDGKSTFIIDYQALDTFTFNTMDYDSIQFYSEYLRDGKPKVLDGFFLIISKNKPFGFEAFPIMPMSGAELIVGNSQLKNIAGKMLYEVTISDDIDPNRIKVMPRDDSYLFIDILKIDSSKYRIKLKDKNKFYENLSSDTKNKWKRGEELKFPIGINLSDTVVTNHKETIQYILVKKKKPKKIKN